MSINDISGLSDRQARAAILAAEALGFEREPDLYERWYDHLLHEDARHATAYLRSHDPDKLAAALVAGEPIPAQLAAVRIADCGTFSVADADRVLEAATTRGFVPPPEDLPLLPSHVAWGQARAAVAFLWDEHPALLSDLLGENAQIAPLPETARSLRH